VLTDALLARVCALPHLRDLNIGSTTKVTAVGLVHLADLTRLEKLTLSSLSHAGEGLGDVALKNIVGLKSLRELHVNECGSTDAGARLLEGIQQLTRLELGGEGYLTDAALASIGKLKRLKYLGLSSDASTAQYGRMHFTAVGLRSLIGLQDLEELHLVNQDVTAEFLSFPKLTSLSLGGSTVDDACAERIAAFHGLKSLSLVYTAVTDAGMKAISTLPALQRLNVDSYVVTDAGIEQLKVLKSLEHLSLRATQLTDESVRHVSEMKTLSRLDLHGSGQPGSVVGELFTLDALRQLKALPELRTLYLYNLRSPGALACLRELTQLRAIAMMWVSLTENELDA
jgi:internalin A